MIDFIMEHEHNFCRLSKPLSKVYGDVCQILAQGKSFEVQMNTEAIEMNRQVCI